MVTIVLSIALLACLGGSVWITKGVRLVEYTSNRSRSGSHHILFSILGSLVGGWMFFGLCAIGYQAGVVGYAIGLGYALGLLLLSRFLPEIKRQMTENDCDTMDDLIGEKFGRPVQTLVTLVNSFFFLAILAAQFIALSAFLQIFTDIDQKLAFSIAVGVVILYTALAGFKGVLLTDVWQFFLLGVSAVLIVWTLASNTAPDSISALPFKFFNGLGFGPGFLVGVLFLFPPSLLARTDLWQRIAAAKDTASARRAFVLAAPILLVFYILLTSVGIFGRAALGPGVTAETSGFVRFLEILHQNGGEATPSVANTVIITILALGVLSALLSTADTNLNIVSVAISKAARKESWTSFEKEVQEKYAGSRTERESRLLRGIQVVTLVMGLFAVVIAYLIPDIVNLIVAAGSSVMLFLPMIVSVLRRQIPRFWPAFLSVSVSFLLLVILLPKIPKIAFIPATLISFIVYFLSRRLISARTMSEV